MNPLVDQVFEEYFRLFPHERRILAFDVETTGFHNSDRLFELAVVGFEFDGYNKKYVEFETLVDPERSIPDEIVNLTGVNDSMIVGAPKDYEAYPKFVSFIHGASRLVAHNSQFDHRMITNNFTRIGMSIPNFEDKVDIHCTMRRAKKLGIVCEKYSLGALCNKFGYVNEHAHRAKDDALATLFLWGKLAIQS